MAASPAYDTGMRFGAAFWMNRTTWPALRDACLAAERAGWDSVWIDDHLLSDEGDPDDPKLEGWSTLAALGLHDQRVRLGLLVAANTFRNPGLTAKLATTADHSDGRAVRSSARRRLVRARARRIRDRFRARASGSGSTGWMKRSGSSAACSTANGSTTRAGSTRCTTPYATPRPVQPRLPILIGGSGPTKTLRTTARYADMWNALRPARAHRRDQRDPPRAVRLRRPPVRRHRAHRHHRRRHPRHGRRCGGRLGDDRAAPRHRGSPRLRWLGARTVGRRLGRRDGRVPRRLRAARYQRGRCSSFRDPFDLETIERVGELRAALRS